MWWIYLTIKLQCKLACIHCCRLEQVQVTLCGNCFLAVKMRIKWSWKRLHQVKNLAPVWSCHITCFGTSWARCLELNLPLFCMKPSTLFLPIPTFFVLLVWLQSLWTVSCSNFSCKIFFIQIPACLIVIDLCFIA